MALIRATSCSGGSGNSFFHYYANTGDLPQTIDVGFIPKYVIVNTLYRSYRTTHIYDADTSTTTSIRYFNAAQSTQNIPVESGGAGFRKVGSDTEIQMSYYDEFADTYVFAIG